MRLPASLAALLLVFLAVVGSGCGPSTSSESPAKPLKTLQVGNGAEPQDLDPHVVTGVAENKIIAALFEGLVAEHPSGTGVAPGVAERWENSADGLIWTFHLRADARWSNGDPVTAEDFIRSFRRMLSPALGANYAYKLHHVVGAEEYNKGELKDFSATGFSAPDARTLVLRLKHRVPYLLEALKHSSWMPVHLPTIEKYGPADRIGTPWTRPGRLVGNGPFMLKDWRPNQAITVVRSPTFRADSAPLLDAIVFHAVDDVKTEERMFRAGQLHVTSTVPPDRIAAYRTDSPEKLRLDPNYATYFYRFNVTRPPLDDARVRRALALAIDREAIISSILRGGQKPALNFTPAGFGFEPAEQLNGNLDEARRLLAEAGYPEGKGLRRLEILYNTQETHKAVAEAVQQMWKTALGVDVSLRNEEWKVYLDSQDNLAFDIARGGWTGDYPDPHTFLDMWISGGGNNDTGYANPAYDRLLESALSTADDAARFAVYRELDAIVTRDAPILPIYFYVRGYLLDPRVVNWVPNLLDNRAWRFIDLGP